MRVLIADDSRTMRRIYRSILSRVGYSEAEIVEVERGEDVVSRLATPESGIDLVIADWDLPGMDGLTLLDQVSRVRSLQDVGIVFIVNAAQRPQAKEAVQRGARAFVTRPFQEEDLREKIRAAGTMLETQRTKHASGVFRAMVTSVREEAELPFLIHLPSKLISEFLKLSRKERHAAGSTLLRKGEKVTDLHVLTAGEVEVIDPGRPSAVEVLGAGECFAEWAFLKEEPSPVTVRARTQLELALLDRAALEGLARRHPELGQYLAARAARRPAVSREATSSSTTEITGNLKTLAFSEVIQFLQAAGKTGILILEKGSVSAQIHFEGGEVRHARAGDVEGEQAFYQVALWPAGTFSFCKTPASHPGTIRLPTMTLLMEAMRLADEAKKEG